MGFSSVGLICGLWLWVCFVVFCGFVLLWLWVCWWWLCCVGDAMLALDCVFFFFFGLATGVCGCGWWANGGVGVCGSVEVGFGLVGGGVGFFFFFFFLVLMVDYGLVVVVVSVCVVRQWW